MGRPRITAEEFIRRAKDVHGGVYDYSLTKYAHAHSKVEIVCRKHGAFLQLPSDHLRTTGCLDCSRERQLLGVESFIEKAKGVHGDKYDYSLVEYMNTSSKVTIICPKHGSFLQTPDSHLRGKGCLSCATISRSKKQSLTVDEFIEKAVEVHGSRFDYSMVEYKNARSKVKIICPIHGVFMQKPDSHVRGSGCPSCANELSGWNKSDWRRAAFASKNFYGFKVYVIRCFNDHECFFKIGRTYNSLGRRFNGIPYRIEVLREITGDADTIFRLEIDLHRLNRQNKYEPKINFKGKHECYSSIEEFDPKVMLIL